MAMPETRCVDNFGKQLRFSQSSETSVERVENGATFSSTFLISWLSWENR